MFPKFSNEIHQFSEKIFQLGFLVDMCDDGKCLFRAIEFTRFISDGWNIVVRVFLYGVSNGIIFSCKHGCGNGLFCVQRLVFRVEF